MPGQCSAADTVLCVHGPRALTLNERALLDRLLSADFPGVEPLRQQAHDLLASPGCTCGCGSIDLFPQGEPPLSEARSPLPSEGVVRDESGEVVGGLICFLEEGLLSHLEVYAWDDPLPLPSADHVDWSSDVRQEPVAVTAEGRVRTWLRSRTWR